MDAIAQDLISIEIDRHIKTRELMYTEKLREMSVGGLLHSSEAIPMLFERAIEDYKTFSSAVITHFQDSWQRERPVDPRTAATQDKEKMNDILSKERSRIEREIEELANKKGLILTSFEKGKTNLTASFEYIVENAVAGIDTLKFRREKELVDERRVQAGKRQDRIHEYIKVAIASLLPVSISSAVLIYSNQKKSVRDEKQISYLQNELSALRKNDEKLVRWNIKTPEEIDRAIKRENDDLIKLKENIHLDYKQKVAAFQGDRVKRGLSASGSGYESGLKRIKENEVLEIIDAEEKSKRRIEDLNEERSKLKEHD